MKQKKKQQLEMKTHRNRPPFKLEKYVVSPDNWNPSYSDGNVRVFIVELKGSCPSNISKYRVGVWGMDDTGMEFDYDNMQVAMHVYESIDNGITYRTLQEMGLRGG
jgi:hypothetical protein